ncbi:hypothetical protein ATCCBAA256_20650 [Mycobacterium montefiorense]|nr:hypothetical protein ATCCBAA256_20650 [Mycobacterium montefiorense]
MPVENLRCGAAETRRQLKHIGVGHLGAGQHGAGEPDATRAKDSFPQPRKRPMSLDAVRLDMGAMGFPVLPGFHNFDCVNSIA